MTTYLDGGVFKTKKALKEAIKEGQEVYVYAMNPWGITDVPDGEHALVGPGPYERKWYASITTQGQKIVKIS